jgi:putative oligomerization/nucleic acid binding protein
VTGQSTVVMYSSSGAFTSLVRPAGGETPDVADTLAKLPALRDRGALTEEEFEAQKKKLLER